MAHDEKGIGKERVDFIQMNEIINETTHPPGIAGRVKMSGSTLYTDNGSAWVVA